jgi:hypothetical protein
MGNYITASGLEVPGLEAIVEYNGLRGNVQGELEELHLVGIGGLQDDPDIRETRDANPDRHGERAGLQLYGGRTLTLEGKVRAGSIGAMRDRWRKVKSAFNGSEHDMTLRVANEQGLVVNSLLNPGAEVDVAGWVSTNCVITRTTSQQERGSGGFLLTASSAATMSMRYTNTVPIKPGQIWSAAAFFKSAVTVRTVRVYVVYLDDSANIITSTAGANMTELTTDFVRPIVEGVIAPPGAVSVRIVAEVVSPANAEVHHIDSLVLVESPTVPDYVDGDQPGCWWNGLPHASASTKGAFAVNAIGNPNGNPSMLGYSNAIAGAGVTWPVADANDEDFGDPDIDGSAGGFFTAIKTSPSSGTTFDLLVPATENGLATTRVVPGQWWAVRARVKITHQFTNAAGALTLIARFRNAALSSVSSVTLHAAAALQSYAVDSIIELEGIVQVPAPAKHMGIQINATVASGATGGAIVGCLQAVRVGGSSSANPAYFDGARRHCGWHGTIGASESIRRQPRPFLIKRVRKSDRLASPEKQVNARPERDFLITARAADPRIYVADERSKWVRLQLSGTPDYVDVTPQFVSTTAAPTGFTAGPLSDSEAHWGDAASNPVILQPGVLGITAVSSMAGPARRFAYRTSEAYTYNQPMVRAQCHPTVVGQDDISGGQDGAVLILLKRVDDNNFIYLHWFQDGNENNISFWKYDGGVRSLISTEEQLPPAPNPPNTWVLAYQFGDELFASVYTTYPSPLNTLPIPFGSIQHSLSAGDITKFGQSVSGQTGIGVYVFSIGGTPFQEAFPWIGRFETGDYVIAASPNETVIPVIGDFENVVPKMMFAGDVVGPSITVTLPSGQTRQVSLNGTFPDANFATLDFETGSFRNQDGTDRWDEWQPYSDFVAFEPGANLVSVLANNWTAGKYQVGFSWRDAYR